VGDGQQRDQDEDGPLAFDEHNLPVIVACLYDGKETAFVLEKLKTRVKSILSPHRYIVVASPEDWDEKQTREGRVDQIFGRWLKMEGKSIKQNVSAID